MRLDPIYAERKKALKYLFKKYLILAFVFWLIMAIFMPFCQWLSTGLNEKSFLVFISQVKQGLFSPFYVYGNWGSWFFNLLVDEPRHYSWWTFFGWRLPLIPSVVLIVFMGWYIVANPYDFDPKYFGYGRSARKSDLKKMKLDGGKYLFLGELGGVSMRLHDTRSAFCCGDPGCGKTTGVVIPNILMADNACLFIHDPKNELFKLTSGYRATKGPVFQIDFSKADDPENGIYYPSWNPLSEDNMPPPSKGRDSYIDTLVEFLIPDGPDGTDPYWVKSGRACLTGMTIYLGNKVTQAKANDYFIFRLKEKLFDDDDKDVLLSYYQGMQQTEKVKEAIDNLEANTLTIDNYLPIGSWSPILKNWVGREASFGMLLDLINNWSFAESKRIKKRRAEGDIYAMNQDVWQIILDAMVNEIFYYGYGRRALLELNQVLALPDKQRASVISMAQTGIELFKNTAIRDRTSSNDFLYSDFRGVKDEATGKYKPVTFYINNDGGPTVCSLFINMVCGNLMDKGPNEGKFGPYPVEFILEDFTRMPKLQSIADGITFGRSKQNIFLVIVQDWHQISAKYDSNTKDVIMSSVAAKIVKRQNNVETRNALMAGIMPLTRRVEASHGGEVGFGPKVNPFIDKGGFKKIKDTVIGGSGILNMANEKQLVLLGGFYHLPIEAKTTLFFKKDSLKVKTQIPPSKPTPDYMADKKKKESENTLDIQLDEL